MQKYFRDVERINLLKAELSIKFPTLYVENKDDEIFVEGCIPVKDPTNGKVLKRYLIRVSFPNNYPTQIPKVFEIGGQIPRKADRHMYENGLACLGTEIDIGRSYNAETTFIDFLTDYVEPFFVSQYFFVRDGKWIYGEWPHNRVMADIMFFQKEFEIDFLRSPYNFAFLHNLCFYGALRGHHRCLCGSGKPIRSCHGVWLQISKDWEKARKIESPKLNKTEYLSDIKAIFNMLKAHLMEN